MLSFVAIVILSPMLLILTLTGSIAMGGNPFFSQPRPGKKDKNGSEKIFKLIKFRTMINEKDSQGNLLDDSMRLNKYGKFLRSTSLDELPELFNILFGSMSIVGPRPQLVRDMAFMNEKQRKRHDVRPGLTGLAQINGRNNITWEQKFEYDIKYIEEGICFGKDLKIIFNTVWKVFKRSDIVREGTDSDVDFGVWLLKNKCITSEEFEAGMQRANKLLRESK